MNSHDSHERPARQALAVLERLEQLEGQVCVFGSLNADLTVGTQRLPDPGETVTGGDLQVLPGGKSANQAVTAGLLGAPTVILGAVGDDAHGRLLVESLGGAGVDTSHVRVEPEVPTGTAIITVDAEGENSIVVSPGANGRLTGADVRAWAPQIESADVLGLCLEVAVDSVAEAARTARAAGVKTVLNVSPAQKLPPGLLADIDVLIVNEHELATLADGHVDPLDERAVAAAVARLGVSDLVVTLGGAGSVVHTIDGAVSVPTFPVAPVDTTGAGDSFMGTLLAALASRVPLAQGAVLASAVSALATTSLGAQASYADAARVRDYLGGL